jgi:hypothetical protein
MPRQARRRVLRHPAYGGDFWTMVVGGASLLSRASIGERADEKGRLRCSGWCRLRVCRILDCVLGARDNVRGGELLTSLNSGAAAGHGNACVVVRRSPSLAGNASPAYPSPEDGFLGAAGPCAGRPEISSGRRSDPTWPRSAPPCRVRGLGGAQVSGREGYSDQTSLPAVVPTPQGSNLNAGHGNCCGALSHRSYAGDRRRGLARGGRSGRRPEGRTVRTLFMCIGSYC